MNVLRSRLVAPVVALLLFTGAHAQAGQISWKYNWTPGSLAVDADGATGGFIGLTSEPPNTATGNSDIVATNLRTVSTALPTSPDQFVTGGHYSLTIQITDAASSETGTAKFTGKLGGTFSGSNAKVTNLFEDPTVAKLLLGGNLYTVTIGPYTPPGPPSAANAGGISAHVDVAPGDGSIQTAPEPSTMVLAFLGLTTVGAGWLRKRRRAVVA